VSEAAAPSRPRAASDQAGLILPLESAKPAREAVVVATTRGVRVLLQRPARA
jgi:hypothetical protein